MTVEGVSTRHFLEALLLSMLVLCVSGSSLRGQSVEPPTEPPAHWGPISINMEEVPYPYPVEFLNRNLYGQDVRIAYMDVAPTGSPNGQTVLLLHGGSYYGWYWKNQIEPLSRAGFRVVVKDRLGWGRSSKPILPYSISLHASNSAALLEHLGVSEAAVVGHSIGGQMASRFAFLYPEKTTHVVMVNPVGLTDRRGGRGWQPASGQVAVTPDMQEVFERALATEVDRHPEWRAEYLEHVRIRYGQRLSGEWPRLAYVQSLGGNLRSVDSVVNDWPHIAIKAMVLGGSEDGPNFPEQARGVVESLQNAELVLIPNHGHNPHESAPEVVNAELIRFLSSDPDVPAGEGR